MKPLKVAFFSLAFFLFFCENIFSQEINPNGYNRFNYPNGNIMSEGKMKDGNPEGYWKNYYPNGQLKSEGNRKSNMLDSLWVFYNEKGDTLKKINYTLGKKGGYYFVYQESNDTLKNSLLSKEMFINDKREGVSYYYYSNGNLHKIINYKENMKHGEAKEYKEDGVTLKTIFKYRYDFLASSDAVNRYSQSGEKQGVWIDFHPNGKVKSQVNYNNGKITGLLKEYDSNGKQIVAEKYQDGQKLAKDSIRVDAKVHTETYPDGTVKSTGAYLDGKPIGIHRTFKEDGTSSIANVYTNDGVLMASGMLDADGKKQGKWSFYFESGKLKNEGLYSSNMKIGEWIFYFESGQIEQKGSYKAGLLSGKWYWYYETGELLREEIYEKGKLEGDFVEYTKAKEIITQGKYLEGEKTGKWFYNVGDQTEEGTYRTDYKTGKWKHYYPNGKLKYECNYELDKENGKAILYYENKKIEEERYYSMGIPERIWRKYDKESVEILTLEYDNGKLIKIDGKKVEEDLSEPKEESETQENL